MVGVFLFGTGSFNVRADEGASGFTISPPVFELRSNPGEQLTEVVSIYNNGPIDLNLVTSMENLQPIGEAGQVQVIQDQEGLPSLKDWLTVKENSFTVKKGETKNVNFTVNVPANADPGGHFATVLFGTIGSPTKNATGALVVQKVGTLVLLTVAGDAKTSADIVEFTAPKAVWHSGAVNLNLRVKNSGSVHVRPRGFLTLTNVFGRQVAQVELDGKNILPGGTRVIPVAISLPKLLVGPVTATVTLTYGTPSQNLNATVGLMVLPWKLLVPLITVLTLLIVLRRRLGRAVLVLLGKV